MEELLERKKGLHRTILIVDDEIIEREMLGAMLQDSYTVIYAENGAVALDIIKQDKLTLSLIILDLHMPEMDGYSLLKIIRFDSELRRIPVIVLTSEREAEITVLQLGAADFITKPYDVPDVVRARVRRSIELAEDSIIIHETERDELTGLFNKEFFYQYGRRLDMQNNDMPMDAMVLDINRFHIVNELYGRHRGDMILKKIGGCIHELVCRTGGLACRFNSNCFGIYLPHVLKQVLINILSNAVKFTNPPGKITLTVERTAVFEDQSTLRFVIRDTGIGMNPEFIPRIFDTFTQEDSSRNSKYGSTGLGMAIAKSIVELMNGTISVSSEKGVGTEFTVVVTLQNSRHSYEDGIGAGPVFRRADGYSDAGDGRLYGGENDPCAAG